MALAKTAIVASSILCATCVAAAVALPSAGPLVKTVEGQAKLAGTYIDFAGQDAFSALPFYNTLGTSTDPDEVTAALTALSSLSGIPALLLYGTTNDPSVFIPASDGSGGYQSLSGLSSLQAYQASGDPVDLAGIDAYSGIPALEAYQASGNIADLAPIAAYSGVPSIQAIQAGQRSGFYGLASTSATESFDHFQAGYADPNLANTSYGPGSFQAFATTPADPVTGGGQQGYAALSGLQSIQNYQNSNGDLSTLNGIDAFSAIKSDTPAPVTDTKGSDTESAADTGTVSSFAKVAAVTPAAPPVTNNKQGLVRNSANYSPAGLPILMGSGNGKGPDSGISGWGSVANGLRHALGMGPDPSTKSDGGDAGGGAAG